MQTLTGGSSIFFQATANHNMCQRNFLLNYQASTLQRQGTMWIYHFPEQRQVTLRYQYSNQWTSYTETLSGAGLISYASRCSISTEEIHTLWELHGSSQATLDAPHMYLSDMISIIASHKMRLLEDITPAEIKRLNDINSQVMESPQTLDVYSFIYVQHTILCLEQHSYWHIIIIITLCTTTIFGILCFSSRFYLHHKFVHYCSKHKLPKRNTEIQTLSASTSEPNHKAIESKNDEPQMIVTFTTYSLQPVS